MAKYVLGIDASSFQGILPDNLYENGVRFAFLKASDGLGGTWPNFAKNWAILRGQNIKVAPYHWQQPATPGWQQAEHMARVVEEVDYDPTKDLPAMLDIEDDDNGTVEGNRIVSVAEDFVERNRIIHGADTIIYSGTWFWDKIGKPDSDYLCQMPYCHSGYPKNKGGKAAAAYDAAVQNALRVSHGPIAYPWHSRGIVEPFWQFDGDGGLVLTNEVDSDFILFNGDMDDLEALIKSCQWRRPGILVTENPPLWQPQTSLRTVGFTPSPDENV
jgi:hypothetical protein